MDSVGQKIAAETPKTCKSTTLAIFDYLHLKKYFWHLGPIPNPRVRVRVGVIRVRDRVRVRGHFGSATLCQAGPVFPILMTRSHHFNKNPTRIWKLFCFHPWQSIAI